MIPPEKLRDYALSVDHETGRDKARVFAAVLGLTQDDWQHLAAQITARVPHYPPTAVQRTAWGYEYTVVVPIDGRNGQTQDVVTGWIVDERGPPHLITAYVRMP